MNTFSFVPDSATSLVRSLSGGQREALIREQARAAQSQVGESIIRKFTPQDLGLAPAPPPPVPTVPPVPLPPPPAPILQPHVFQPFPVYRPYSYYNHLHQSAPVLAHAVSPSSVPNAAPNAAPNAVAALTVQSMMQDLHQNAQARESEYMTKVQMESQQRRKSHGKKRKGKGPGSSSPSSSSSSATASTSAPSSSSATAPTSDVFGDAEEGDQEICETKSLYTPYQPRCMGFTHPSRLVSTSTMVQAHAPLDLSVLHPKLRHNPKVSDVQNEAVAMAYNSFLDEENLGFCIGDGTGVGKGRELVAIMLNDLLWRIERDEDASTFKYIFITTSQLEGAFVRDLKDLEWPTIGKNSVPMRSLNDYKIGEKVKMKKGILFVTYATLRYNLNKKRSRVDQVVEWATGGGKKTFDGVIAIDEIQSAKNGSTSTGEAVKKLQDLLEHAKVVYASATAMSKIDHLYCMPRLGLWGNKKSGRPAAYPTFKHFHNAWATGPRSWLEIVAAHLASKNLYISRRLSFEGTTFKTCAVALTETQTKTHSELCEWWNTLMNMSGILEGKHLRSQLYAAHLRFFRSLLVSYRVEKVAQMVRETVEGGGSAVVSLIGTGEAAAKRSLADQAEKEKKQKRDAKEAAPGTSLASLASLTSLTSLASLASSDDANDVDDGFVALQSVLESVVHLAVSSFQGESLPSKLSELRDKVDSFNLPPSPLDYLIHLIENEPLQDGSPVHVCELTGRAGGFYKNASTGNKWSYTPRKQTNAHAAAEFQKGKKRVAIISTAGSVGVSLHNDRAHPDLPRTHYIIELPYAADQAIQALGRTHRSNQHNAPTYVLVTSDLMAETRFAATVSKRASDLGALTNGDRRGSQSETAFGSDLLVGQHASEGLRLTFSSLNCDEWPRWCLQDSPDEAWDDFKAVVRGSFSSLKIDQTTTPRQLLGRLLGLDMLSSNSVMRLFESACAEIKTLFETRRRMDDIKMDVGVEDVVVEEGGRVRILGQKCNKMIELSTDAGVTFEQALEKGREHASNDGKFSFFKLKTPRDGGRSGIALVRRMGPRVEVLAPNGRKRRQLFYVYKSSHQEVGGPDGTLEEGSDKYNEAKQLWDEEYATSLTTCSHGSNCKMGSTCTFGKREVTSMIIKLPCLDALSSYNGYRQLVRYEDRISGERCCAVRISKAADYSCNSLYAALEAEEEGQEVAKAKYEAAKRQMMGKRGEEEEKKDEEEVEMEEEEEEEEIASSPLLSVSSSAASSPAGKLQFRSDEDEDEDEDEYNYEDDDEKDDDDDDSESSDELTRPPVIVKRRRIGQSPSPSPSPTPSSSSE